MTKRQSSTLSSIVSSNPILSSVVVLVIGFFGSQIYNTQFVEIRSNNKMELIGTDIKQIKESFGELKTQIEKLVDKSESDIKLINSRIEDIKERLTKLEGTVINNTTKLNQLSDKK